MEFNLSNNNRVRVTKMPMSADQLATVLLDIKESLGCLQGKQKEIHAEINRIAQHVEKTDDRLEHLPCAKHIEDVNMALSKKLNITHFITVMGVVLTLVSGAYIYANNIDKEAHAHAIDKSAHHEQMLESQR